MMRAILLGGLLLVFVAALAACNTVNNDYSVNMTDSVIKRGSITVESLSDSDLERGGNDVRPNTEANVQSPGSSQ